MSEHGMNVNLSVVQTSDKVINAGMHITSSDGLDISTEIEGTDYNEILNELYNTAVCEAVEQYAKLDEEDDVDCIGLEEENEKLREHIEYLNAKIEKLEDKIACKENQDSVRMPRSSETVRTYNLLNKILGNFE